jgi:signal transduction histidine kinase
VHPAQCGWYGCTDAREVLAIGVGRRTHVIGSRPQAKAGVIRSYIEGTGGQEDYRYSQSVAVVVRWVVLVAWLALLNYRPDVEGGTLMPLNLLAIPLAATNAYVTWRIRSGRLVTARYVYALSLVDLVVATTGVAITRGFDNTFFVFYYPILVGFSVVFHRRRIAFGFAALGIGAYVLVSLMVAPGVDFDAAEERILIARVVSMAGVVIAANLMTRIERARRIAAVGAERERAAENMELQQQAMTAELAVTKERGRIAREIHDGIAQEVYMLGLGLETSLELADRDPAAVKQPLQSLLPVARQTLLHTRNYLYDLKPLMDGDQQLPALAQSQVEEFTAITGLPVDLSVEGEERKIEFQRAAALYRMIQESLANVLKHAEAGHVTVVVTFEPEVIRIAIEDDGVGFDPASHHLGYGLTNIRERAEELSGGCEMVTTAGAGTVVRAWVPA